MLKNIALILLGLIPLHIALGTNSPEFDRANQEYDGGHFEEARKLYDSLVDARNYSSNLFYNLGNADYRLGDKGSAMLNYERAIALEPTHPEALSNLEFLRNQTGAKVERAGWFEHLFLPFDVSSYALIAAAAGWVTAFCLAAILLGQRGGKGRLWTAAICCTLLCCYAATAVWLAEKERTVAIITARQAEARFAPADTAALMATLPTGSRVRVLADRGPWVYCALPDRSRGWVSSKSLKRIRLLTS